MATPRQDGVAIDAEGGIFRFRPALARRLQFIRTKRKEIGVGGNIDSLHKAGLGQGFGIVDCGMLKQRAEGSLRPVGLTPRRQRIEHGA